FLASFSCYSSPPHRYLHSFPTRRSSDLLLLEAYRECLRDVFDMPALLETLRAIEQRQLRVHVVETRKPSPFASSLLFSYVANFVDRKSTRLNSSHLVISYAVFCLKKKTT